MKALKFMPAVCFLFIPALFSSCSKKNISSSEQGLAGTWNWVRTDGGFGNHIHTTPASTGKTVELKFTGDNRYYIYTNGTITSQGTYTTSTQKSIRTGTEKEVIVFSSAADSKMLIETVNRTSLELTDNFYDGLVSMYTRK